MKKKGFIGEFKEFISRGNVLDLAVGVIIGGAFKGITDSLVNDILNPLLGLFTGGNQALAALSITLPGGVELMVGNFINAVLNFLIMSFVIFLIVKGFNSLRRKKEDEAKVPETPALSTQEKLLTEIRDLLKEKEDV